LVTLIAIHNEDIRNKRFNKTKTSKTGCAEKPMARSEKVTSL
jgi:hypothetical protein